MLPFVSAMLPFMSSMLPFLGKNSGKRYRMAYCVVKETISARTCLNQRMKF